MQGTCVLEKIAKKCTIVLIVPFAVFIQSPTHAKFKGKSFYPACCLVITKKKSETHTSIFRVDLSALTVSSFGSHFSVTRLLHSFLSFGMYFRTGFCPETASKTVVFNFCAPFGQGGLEHSLVVKTEKDETR